MDKEKRGDSVNEVEILMEEVTKRLPETREYNQYKNLLERLKEQPDLYHRVGEFRRRSIMLQMSDNVCAVHANNELQNEFRDLQNNGLSSEFLAAEHQYCQMIRRLQEKFLESAQIETDFLEG